MYRCQICKQVVPAGTKARRVVSETRPRIYPFRMKANRAVRIKDKLVYPDDPGGTGWEIAREITVCPACAERWTGKRTGSAD
jgi:hypothetical protein